MKGIALSALFAGMCLSAAAQATTSAPAGYTLRWADEFNGSALNDIISKPSTFSSKALTQQNLLSLFPKLRPQKLQNPQAN